MEKQALEIKAAIVAFFSFWAAFLGWFGILVVALGVLSVTDWITGTRAAKRTGSWTSQRSREGIGHKGAMLAYIVVAGVADVVLGTLVNVPQVPLPFTYTVLFCPIVIIWYIFSEMGSIAENAEKLGGSHPPFVKTFVEIMKSGIVEYVKKQLGKKDE